MFSEDSDWKTFYNEAKGYHKTLNGCLKRPKVFIPVIVSNIAAMCIEKYFMAAFMYRGVLPANHTMADFIETAAEVKELSPELVEIMEYMDSIQMICSFFNVKTVEPEEKDIPRFIKAADMVAEYVDGIIGSAVPV